MLLAHLVPGYFAANFSQTFWNKSWVKSQKVGLWLAALGSTVAPDSDVIYNILFRGFANHSVLWTHSLLPHLGIALIGLLLPRTQRWAYWRLLLLLVAVGGISHLFLDVIVHGTPLFYPFSNLMVGWPPQQVVDGGLWGYLTHPLVLLEPLLLGLMAIHYRWQRQLT